MDPLRIDISARWTSFVHWNEAYMLQSRPKHRKLQRTKTTCECGGIPLIRTCRVGTPHRSWLYRGIQSAFLSTLILSQHVTSEARTPRSQRQGIELHVISKQYKVVGSHYNATSESVSCPSICYKHMLQYIRFAMMLHFLFMSAWR
jgi:hypothetical protein